MSNGSRKILVILLLLTYWTLAITSVRNKSTTFDEIQHLTAGYTYWMFQDFRLHPENGILSQKLLALPLLFSDSRFPSLSQSAWWTSNVLEIGYQFLYQQGNDADAMMLKGRMVIALMGVALGLCVYLWSKQLFGKTGGMISLLLYAFCPTMLANGSLATSDMTVALFFTIAVLAFWKMLQEPNWKSILLSSFAIGGLFLAKFSAFVFFPIASLLVLVRFVLGPKVESPNKMQTAALAVGAALIHCLILFGAIWTLYDFRFSVFNPADAHPAQLFEPWEHFGPVRFHSMLDFAREKQILPEAYLYGFATVLKHGESRRAFLNGQYSLHGWWYFFPYSFFAKTPIPTLFILILSFAAGISKWRREGVHSKGDVYQLAPLLILLVVYWGVAITSSLNIGHRHILPTYPALFILAGGASWWFSRNRSLPRILMSAMIVWLIAETVFTYPNFLTYFNEVAGGPKNGYEHLVDSSLDWGQDLPALKGWIEKYAAGSPVYLSYFGTGSPEYYGIKAKRLPSYINLGHHPEETEFREGVYAISATMLQSVYSYAAGHWNVLYERAYQRLLKSSTNDVERFNLQQLRFTRLCSYLRHRTPTDSVGYSILIFRLSKRELDEALYGPPAELHAGVDMK